MDNSISLWHAWSTMPKRSSKGLDPNLLAYRVVQDATATPSAPELTPPSKAEISRVMAAIGRVGGRKGGKARAKNLSDTRLKEIARQGAAARWDKKYKKK